MTRLTCDIRIRIRIRILTPIYNSNHPLFLFWTLLAISSTFKAYPALGDFALPLTILPLFHRIVYRLAYPEGERGREGREGERERGREGERERGRGGEGEMGRGRGEEGERGRGERGEEGK